MKLAIENLFKECNGDDQKLIDGLDQLADQHGNLVYQETLRHLVGKSFNAETATRYWQEAIAHREQVLVSTRQNNALRPALLDYLHQVVREIDDPRIVEANDLEQIRKSSMQDGLTGLFNQTYFKTHLGKIVSQRLNQDETTVGCVLFDIDHFKQYNDRCGHVAGDVALQQVAKAILAGVREGDVAARYGGEEFAIILTQVTAEQTFTITDRIRQSIEDLDIADQHLLDRKNLTISAGYALHESEGETGTELLKRADSELYKAKLFRNAVSPHQLDNRKGVRRKRHAVIEYAPASSSTFMPAISHDISTVGVAIECEQVFTIGTPLILRFRKPFWPGDRQVMATVCHSQTQENKPTRLGLKFTPELALSHENSDIPFTDEDFK